MDTFLIGAGVTALGYTAASVISDNAHIGGRFNAVRATFRGSLSSYMPGNTVIDWIISYLDTKPGIWDSDKDSFDTRQDLLANIKQMVSILTKVKHVETQIKVIWSSGKDIYADPKTKTPIFVDQASLKNLIEATLAPGVSASAYLDAFKKDSIEDLLADAKERDPDTKFNYDSITKTFSY